ncbi:hypothetical protein RJ639_015102 [Escallonia herrerae]|uniref:Glucan endo-1,3-beta-D-glucosidase n=1 Tax=Escallonia herrerae TaxID=1293975 RepID=A0AA89AQ92_9ASTE|nr:hypothetical protein RJ639_015102 [Escallonia herrerae]
MHLYKQIQVEGDQIGSWGMSTCQPLLGERNPKKGYMGEPRHSGTQEERLQAKANTEKSAENKLPPSHINSGKRVDDHRTQDPTSWVTSIIFSLLSLFLHLVFKLCQFKQSFLVSLASYACSSSSLSFPLNNEGVKGIGVNYGLLGDNLPPPDQVIALLKSKNIRKIRIFDPNQDVLNALHGSDISVILGVRNEDLRQLASTPSFATAWVNTNVVAHSSSVKFTYVSAGNEVVGGELSSYVLGAMQNLDAALVATNIAIPVSTTVS